MAKAKLAVRALERVPKNLVSRAFGVISDVELPRPVQKVVNHSFAALVGVDVAESERPPGEYSSLNAYFTRHLREGARQVACVDDVGVVSPVDGKLGAFGRIDEGTLLQAKGRQYKVVDLLDSAAEASRFQGGSYATIYLSPKDYHRIHSPVRGEVAKVSYIPGHLFPVNPFAVENIDELFAVNERLISYMETPDLGRVAVIKVGATCVGRICLSYDGIQTNKAFRRRQEYAPRQKVDLQAGDELAVFELGSTVILLIESEEFRFCPQLNIGKMLRMGAALGE